MSVYVKPNLFDFAFNEINGENMKSPDNAFFVVDIEDIIDKHKNWINKMPNVRPFYAIKVNNAQIIVEVLAGLGIGFDCASKREIEQVLAVGVDPSLDIIYANPCKSIDSIQYASSHGIDLMTFDNEFELKKISEHFPKAKLVLRLKVYDTNSKYPLGSKFGVKLNKVSKLLRYAVDLGLTVIGVSFHVGCRVSDERAYSMAIADSKEVFRIAKDEFNIEMTFLDIGGGFPGAYWHSGPRNEDMFDRIAHTVNTSLEQHFPVNQYPNLQVIAEPGTYFSSAFYLAVKIIGKRIDDDDDDEENGKSKLINYYVNEGLHGSFTVVKCDFIPHVPKPLLKDNQLELRNKYRTVIWGQTLDSSDFIIKEITFTDMNIGEWILFRDMGDYTFTLVTPFNGYPPSDMCYYVSNEIRSELMKLRTWTLIKRRIEKRKENQNEYLDIIAI